MFSLNCLFYCKGVSGVLNVGLMSFLSWFLNSRDLP